MQHPDSPSGVSDEVHMSPLNEDLIPSESSDLRVQHPTPEESGKIWTSTHASWGDSLPLPIYLQESQFLTTIPLAKDNNMTTWILVNKNSTPNHRRIFSSCETFRKRSLTSNTDGYVEENIIHGIASVFCPSEYRCRGYAARMVKELAKILPTWRVPAGKQCVGSILYSDIGKDYYATLGWTPESTNSHIDFPPRSLDVAFPSTKSILESDLPALCKRDEALLRSQMAVPSLQIKNRVTVIPDLDHMHWHIRKEDFATKYLFDKIPKVKGAIAGEPGRQVWAIWVRRYYDHPESGSHENTLYVLRLVVEYDETATRLPEDAGKLSYKNYDEQLGYVKAVLQAAQAEATNWRLNRVCLWNPTPLVRKMISESKIEHVEVERQEESIASAMWYDGIGQAQEAPAWVNNEYYSWL